MLQKHIVRNAKTLAVIAGAVNLAAVQFASAVDKTWAGAAGANWNVAGNWNPAVVPAAADDLVFQGTGGTTSVANSAHTFATIAPRTGTHTVTNSSTLNAQALQATNGSFTLSGGTATFASLGNMGVNGVPPAIGATGISMVAGYSTGNSATVNITGGAVVSGKNTYAGLGTGSFGRLNITGPGTSYTTDPVNFTHGRFGTHNGTGTITVDNGATVFCMSLETRGTASSMFVTVGGTGSGTVFNAGQMVIGRGGADPTVGRLDILAGATYNSIPGIVGTIPAATSAGNTFVAGGQNTTATMNVAGGGKFIAVEDAAQAATVGTASVIVAAGVDFGATAVGTLLVSGAGSELRSADLRAGWNGLAQNGHGTVIVSGGGKIIVDAPVGGANIGMGASSFGTGQMFVTGPGTEVTVNDNGGLGTTIAGMDLNATGSYTISNQAIFNAGGDTGIGWEFAGGSGGGNAALSVDNAAFNSSNGSQFGLAIGTGSTGTMNISNGGTVSISNMAIGSFFAGDLAANANVNINGGTLFNDDIGAVQISTNGGLGGGTTTINITNAGVATISSDMFVAGDAAGGFATINVGSNSFLANDGLAALPGQALFGVTGSGPGSTAIVNVNDGGTFENINGLVAVGVTSTLNIGNAPASFGGFVNHNGSGLFVDGRVNLRSGVTFGSLIDITDGGSFIASPQNTPGNNGNVNSLIVTGTITTNATGVVDMGDNDMVVAFQPQSEVVAQLVAGRGPGDWSGTNGITSSSANTRPSGNTTLGIMSGADYQSIYGAGAVFEGYTTDGTETALIKYTYYGDTDFNGIVDFDDYVRIDGGFNGGLTGWINGDFDYSGGVDFDDYVLIDNAFNTQNETLSAAAEVISRNLADYGVDGVSRAIAELDRAFADDQAIKMLNRHMEAHGLDYAQSFLSSVPEPTSMGLIGLVGAGILGRRRRSR